MSDTKRVNKLTATDLESFPIWQYTNSDDDSDETAVRPIARTPVKSLKGRVVGTQVTLADGSRRWALLGNVDPGDPRLTSHFLTLSVLDHGKWFTLARYHDFDADERGPKALAAFLKLLPKKVFPISYDIRDLCIGESSALAGSIEKEPKERLTRGEIIGLAVPKKSDLPR